MEAKDRILVALDTNDICELERLGRALGEHVGGFKIGLEALLSIGLEDALDTVREYCGPAGHNIFVDAKIHDKPRTMAGAVRAVVAHPQVKFVNVHASAGAAGMRAAADTKGQAKLLAVTILTSLDAKGAAPVYGRAVGSWDAADIGGLVLKFARMAQDAGCDGMVCSPQEVSMLRLSMPAPKPLLVTPGVRPTWATKNDQERVATPGEAVKAGADYLVIGRPITDPPYRIGTPAAAAKLIAEEIAEALA